jgi:hypothetical protein
MLPSTFQALAVFLLAIVPRFLATGFWARAKTWKGRPGDLLTVLQSIAVSLVIQVIVAPLTIYWLYPVRAHLEKYPWRICVWSALVVLIVPWVGGTVLGRLADWVFDPRLMVTGPSWRRIVAWLFRPAVPPTIWDWLFTANPPDGCFVVLEFTDGRRIAGTYSAGAYALTSPEPQGIFLPEEWALDDHGDLIAPVPGTGGVMLLSSSTIRQIRILKEGSP